MKPFRVYSAGIADFANLRQMNCIYADKTDLIYHLTHECRYAFLSRPRRFGKSLLCSTLKYYFQGKRELFKGLMMEQLESDWTEYPVLHFDLSACKNATSFDTMISELQRQLSLYEEEYDIVPAGAAPGQRLSNLIIRSNQKTKRQVVVIFDEYDAPLLDYLHKPEELEQVRRIMQEFYQPVKICDQYLRFCFITGITKFSHLSIFSTLNNLVNISMVSHYSAICGITPHELETVFAPDLELLADSQKCSIEELKARLKLKYDGYRFCDGGAEIYNPFSLTNAFLQQRLDNFWFASGTPTYLFEQMKRFKTDILEFKDMRASADEFDVPTESMTSVLPLLYQSGYLTIKDYDDGIYTLDFPNGEVRSGFMKGFLQQVMQAPNSRPEGFAIQFTNALKRHEIEQAMQLLKSFLSSIPYLDHGSDELDELTKFEAYYETLMYVIFSIISGRVQTQVKTAKGRADVVMHIGDTTYVLELKVNGTAQEALDQIHSKGYAIPYEVGGNVVRIGILFSRESRTVDDWKMETVLPSE